MMSRAAFLILLLLLLVQSSFPTWGAALDPAVLRPIDIGLPALPGATQVVNGHLEISGGGAGLGPRKDQFHFAAVEYTNDFDLKVRVTALEATDVLARAGLMVRDNLDSNAPFVGVFTSPSAAGSHLLSRATSGGAVAQAGLFPPNLPYAWLRLQRQGNLYTGLASADGTRWSVLGSTTVTMQQPLVGFAVTAHSANQLTQAEFADLADAGTGDRIAPLSVALEPPGPTSRRSAIIISEVMYHPPERSDGRNGEFVEIYNSQPFFEDISGWKVAGDYDFTFPANTLIPGGAFLLVAPFPADITLLHGLTNVLGGFTNALSRGNGALQLLNDRGAVMFDLNYRDKPPWPLASDGAGHSLALVRPSYGEADPKAWGASSRPGGSPGAWESLDASPRRQLKINEVLLRSLPGGPEPFVELYNPSSAAVELDRCRLGYGRPGAELVLPTGTRLEPGAYLVLTATQLGFALRADAETLLLQEPADAFGGGAVLDAVRFEPAAAGVSRGRFPNGMSEAYALDLPTPGTANRSPRTPEVVLNEIFHSPLSGDDDLQFIELHNPGSFGVSLSGWRLEDGIRFDFPSSAFLPPGGFVVVARNASRLRAARAGLNTANCLGNFDGRLSGRGERVVLERPENVPAANGFPARTVFVPVDEVTYRTGGQWGFWSDGGGSSLELIDPRADRRFGAHWADSDETSQGRWTTIETTGVLDNGSGAADALHVGLMGEGECLLDNLEVIGPGGTNLITNGDFEGATTGFTVLGNHIRSSLETGEGDASARSLHIRASGNMDTGANRIRFRLVKSLSPGDTATVRARVRWLKGWPEPLLRLHGNWLEATGRLDFPAVGGTPGASNSRRVANAGPALAGVSHVPVLPTANEPVVISVRASDPDGLSAPTLKWRLDPSGDVQSTPMRDDGAEGDERADDGVFSATVPGHNTGALVAFTITAADAALIPASSVFPATPGQECLIRFGEPALANAFGTYRLWITRTNVSRWSNRPNLSNEPISGTLVYGNFRAIHGAGYRFSGSPYHQQFSSPTSDCHYVWRLPGDDRLLGSDNFNKIHAPGNGPYDDDTIQREQTVYWMAEQLGLPSLYRRYVNVFVNGSKRRYLMEDTQVPSGDFVASYYPQDQDGDLYKINPWFEFEPGTGSSINFNNVAWADLNDYRTTDGTRKLGRYRWNWQPRAAQGTVNNYTNLFTLVDVVNAPSEDTFIRGLEGEADVEQWLRTFALNHAVGNWDSFGHVNAQNMYAYKPENGRWQLMMWDANIVLGHSIANGPTQNDLFDYNGADLAMIRIYGTPKFRRAYWRFLKDIVDGPMQAAPVGKLIDAKYAAFQAAGANATSGSSIKTWIRSRVTFLRSQIAQVSALFSARAEGIAGGTTSQNVVTLAGTAPLGVRTITVNGVEPRVVWTSETDWMAVIVLSPGNNRLTVAGVNSQGQIVAGTTRQINIRFTGQPELPEEKLVFSEIHYRPATPGAEFVELLNAATQNAFDLSGWRVDGLGYTFPPATILLPGTRWVLARDASIFSRTYDPTRASFQGVFPGTLSPDGETLKLIRPGLPPATDEVITAVTYSPSLPWPAIAAGGGSSLQLVDPSRSEDDRVGNWAAVPPRNPGVVEWKFASVTGTSGADGTLQLYLSSFPPVTDPLKPDGVFFGSINFDGSLIPAGVRFEHVGGTLTAGFLFDLANPDATTPMVGVSQTGLDVRFGFDPQSRFTGKIAPDGSTITGRYLFPGGSAPYSFTRINPGGEIVVDDITLVTGRTPEVGPNLLANGSFESDLTGSWATAGTHELSERTSAYAHTGVSALRVAATGGGTGASSNAVVQSVSGLTPGTEVTLSFWYLGSTNGSGFVARFGDGAVELPLRLEPPKDPHNEYTPGYPNTTVAALPPFPDLWLNEVLPDPINGAPFAELLNHGTNALNLEGFFLSDSTTQSLRDAFPAGLNLGPGEFLRITLDGSGRMNDPAGPHTSFRPSAAHGALFLTRVLPDQTNLVDFLRWETPARGRSVGHHPDASPHDDREFTIPTPGAPNSLAVPLQPIVINEWMALNTRFPDPAGGPEGAEYDDWFELFNPNTSPVNLDGYILSNAIDDRAKFRIPTGYSVRARGFLLVWADNQSRQNVAGQPNLHVNFKLSGGGEVIALFAPDGSLVDAVTFGQQQQNVSEGRATDGASGAYVRFTSPSAGSSNGTQPPATPPELAAPMITPQGALTLQWTAESGRRYQVRWKESLDGPWQPLGSPVTASGVQATASDSAPELGIRYYQVIVVE